MLGRDIFIRMFEVLQFETQYLAMQKYFLLSFKVCLSIKLAADVRLVPISETRNSTAPVNYSWEQSYMYTCYTHVRNVEHSDLYAALVVTGTGGNIFR
jgi:hypothetical protein